MKKNVLGQKLAKYERKKKTVENRTRTKRDADKMGNFKDTDENRDQR